MTALFSTAYMPPVAYMAALMKYPEVLIETQETFPKQTYRNRAIIMTAGGVRTLSVPTVRNNHSRTEEVGIDYRERWNVIHLRTLEAAYSASPYYLYYKDAIVEILMHRYEKLLELNDTFLHWIISTLKIPCHIKHTEDYLRHSPDDYRTLFSPKIPYPTDHFPPYYQVFSDRIPFTPNLSVIDLMMNLGPEAGDYLKKLT
jgi:hypothetical protein